MSDSKPFSLINLDGASDVVIKFLEMIQDATGWVVTPHGTRKDFNEALEIYKKSIIDSELSGIEKAAKISSVRKELKQYINQSKVIGFAISDLNQNGKINTDEDWLTYFFNYAQNISDETVQRIWARILAEHCNGDTSIKRILIHTLSLLDSESAIAFGNLCKITFECPIKNIYQHFGTKFLSKYIPLVIDPKISGLYLALSESAPEDARYKSALEYTQCIPSPASLTLLQEIGLIDLPEKRGENFEYPYNCGMIHHDFSGKGNSYTKTWVEDYIITYGEDKYIIKANGVEDEDLLNCDFDSEKNLPATIKFGRVKFTTVGETLYSILKMEKLEGFEEILKLYIETQPFSVIKKNIE